MLEKIQKFARDQELYTSEDRILLAVSGGMDSMVMAFLFQQSKPFFGIAHCHFRLRGEEADLDQQLVEETAKAYEVPFHTIQWDTATIAKERKQSIQVCARELRYTWLEQICKQEGYTLIATAHHLNDSLETVLYNFSKGCGIRGLLGVPVKNGKIIRPLSSVSREEIQAFCQKEQLAFREDASNTENKYTRNQIRQQVVPVLKKINPALEATIADNLQRLRETHDLYHYAIQQLKAEHVEVKREQVIIAYQALLKAPAPASLLYEILAPYGFNNTQIRQLLQAPADKTGRQFSSASHQLFVERGKIILRPLSKDPLPAHFKIEQDTQRLDLPGGEQLSFQQLSSPPLSFPTSAQEVFLDTSQLTYPLHLRHWQAGDRFQPLGMKGKHQSLQDFFTNNKLSNIQKEHCWILLSANQICWVVGHRIDERFKIHAGTKSCLNIRYTKEA